MELAQHFFSMYDADMHFLGHLAIEIFETNNTAFIRDSFVNHTRFAFPKLCDDIILHILNMLDTYDLVLFFVSSMSERQSHIFKEYWSGNKCWIGSTRSMSNSNEDYSNYVLVYGNMCIKFGFTSPRRYRANRFIIAIPPNHLYGEDKCMCFPERCIRVSEDTENMLKLYFLLEKHGLWKPGLSLTHHDWRKKLVNAL